MIKTVDEYVNIFKDMTLEKEIYNLHIQVGEHIVHLNTEDEGFNVLYNVIKDFKVELIKFSQLNRSFDLCFKYII